MVLYGPFSRSTPKLLMVKTEKIRQLLGELENALRIQSLWQNTAPTKSELASSMPFAVDTLRPEQWLQWIFIPRMIALIDTQQAIPNLEIHPYFSHVWQQPSHADLLSLIFRIDEACKSC